VFELWREWSDQGCAERSRGYESDAVQVGKVDRVYELRREGHDADALSVVEREGTDTTICNQCNGKGGTYSDGDVIIDSFANNNQNTAIVALPPIGCTQCQGKGYLNNFGVA
jgi:hypothetical protein